MTIEKNWTRLYKFWDELDFEKAKAYEDMNRKEIGDTLVYEEEDIQKLNNLLSIKKEFKNISNMEIEEFEKNLDVRLPIHFKESLSINAYDPEENNFRYSWIGNDNRLLNPDEIIEYSIENRDIDYEIFEDFNNLEQKDYEMWSDKWVVLFDWNGDYFIALDLREDEAFYGKVLCYCLEDGSIAKWSDSYEEWFEIVVDEVLQYGQLRLSTIENLLSPPRSAFGTIVK